MLDDKKDELLGSKLFPSNNFEIYHQEVSEDRTSGTGELFKNSDKMKVWFKEQGSRIWCFGMRKCIRSSWAVLY